MADRQVRVLYVEDDPDIRAVVRLTLEALGGFTVEVCSSGDEALQRAPAFQPRLILLDVMMPGMDGPTTLGKLRELPQFTATPVIFITTRVQPDEVAGYMKLGAAGVIPKPFDPMTLSNQVQEIWERHHD